MAGMGRSRASLEGKATESGAGTEDFQSSSVAEFAGIEVAPIRQAYCIKETALITTGNKLGRPYKRNREYRYVPMQKPQPYQVRRPVEDFARVLEMRAGGKTFQAIGDKLGVSKQRAMAIHSRASVYVKGA
jgi:hypothetical protein